MQEQPHQHTNIQASTIPTVHTATWSESQQTAASTMRLASPWYQYWGLPTTITAFSVCKEEQPFLHKNR